jgi:hypothetical protein
MTEKQKKQAHEAIHYFFNNPASDYVQLKNTIVSIENATVKCMLIMNAIDLLSQYYAGELKNNRTSNRIKTFLSFFSEITAAETELLFQFRNALNHHFGSFSYNHLANRKYFFKIISDKDNLIFTKNEKTFLSIFLLEQLFIDCENRFKKRVSTDEKAMYTFLKVYKFIHP